MANGEPPNGQANGQRKNGHENVLNDALLSPKAGLNQEGKTGPLFGQNFQQNRVDTKVKGKRREDHKDGNEEVDNVLVEKV